MKLQNNLCNNLYKRKLEDNIYLLLILVSNNLKAFSAFLFATSLMPTVNLSII